MANELQKLEMLLSHTNAELNRADAKFRNVGTINSLMIGALTAVLLFATKYGVGPNAIMSEGHKILIISVVSFFLIINILSIIVAIYGVWPRKKYAHNVFDLRYIATGKMINEDNFVEKFTTISTKQMIAINAASLRKKRAFIKVSMFLTVFPFSIIIICIISKQDKHRRAEMHLNKKNHIKKVTKK